jgi:hypothetical protein
VPLTTMLHCLMLQVLSDAHEHGAAVLGVPMKATVKVSLYALSVTLLLKSYF